MRSATQTWLGVLAWGLGACSDGASEQAVDAASPALGAGDGGVYAAPGSSADAAANPGLPGSGCDVSCGADAAPGSVVTPAVDAGGPALPAEDCELGFELRAGDGAGGAFAVPLENDHYECFYFKADAATAGALATSLSPILDDTRVLHHWLLFASDKEEGPSGTSRKCDGIHPNAYLMAAWLPGTPALQLPPDVGMEMPSGPTAQYILENHYNNTARYTDSVDRSGVKVCATRNPKPTLAAIHWLGSERIFLQPNAAGSAAATCTPSGSDPIHILGVIPHLHRLGRHVNMTILRANGAKETLHDAPFDFESQGFYARDVVLMPGDRVSTKCDYQNTTGAWVSLGEATTNEMCYMFTLAYPVGRMNTGGDYINPATGQPYVQGPNRCMR